MERILRFRFGQTAANSGGRIHGNIFGAGHVPGAFFCFFDNRCTKKGLKRPAVCYNTKRAPPGDDQAKRLGVIPNEIGCESG